MQAKVFDRDGQVGQAERCPATAIVGNGVWSYRWEGFTVIRVQTQDTEGVGAPLEPGRAGREVFHQYRDAFRRLADS
jgi:hypothetical protein